MPDRLDETLDLIAKLEGSGDTAVSPKGAIGKYQIMPDTAKRFGYDPERLTDPAYNRMVARSVVEELDKTFHGDQKSVLVGYNASSAVRRRWLASGMDDSVLPQETQKYLVNAGYGNRPGRAPKPAMMAAGAIRIQAMIDGGVPQAQIEGWRTRANDAMKQGGVSEEAILQYWGDKEAAQKPIDTNVQRNVVDNIQADPASVEKFVETPYQAFEYGMQMSVAGLSLRGQKPDRVMPQDAGLFTNVVSGLTTGVADIPVFVGGFIGGVAAGGAAGGAVGGPGGAVAGGVIGGPVGAAALPSSIRNVLLDQYDHPDGVKSWREFSGRAGAVTLQTAKDTAAGSFGFFLGGAAGQKLIQAGAKPLLATTTNLVSTAIGQTAAASAMEGKVPTTDEALAATIMMVGMHGAATVGGRVFATKSGAEVQKNVQDVYRSTGVRPLEVAEMAANDPVIRGEVLSRQADGELNIPALEERVTEHEGVKADIHEETISTDARNFNRAMDRAFDREDAALGMGRYGSTVNRDFLDQRIINMMEAFGEKAVEEPDLISQTEALTDIQNAIGGKVLTKTPSGRYIFGGPEGDIIGTYLRTYGELAGFAFKIDFPERAAAGTEEGRKGGIGPHFARDSKGRSTVVIPNTPEELSRRWYGLGRYEIIHHEVAHAIDFKDVPYSRGNAADGWLSYALKHNPELRAEAIPVSQQFRPKLWATNPNYTSTIRELAADTIAAYISNPAIRASMPKLEAFFGDRLKPYLEAAEKALPKKTDGKTWSDAPGFKPEPEKDQLGDEEGGANGAGGKPPNGGAGSGAGAEGPRRISGPVEPADVRTMYDRLSETMIGTKGKSRRTIFSFTTIYRQFMTELQSSRDADVSLKVGANEFGVTDAVRRAYNGRDLAAHFILRGTSSAKTGADTHGPAYVDGLKAVKEDGGNMEDFNKFRVALRLLELQKRGIIPNDEALSFAGEIVRNREEQAKYGRGIQTLKEHKDKVVDFGVDAEVFSKEGGDAMKRLNLAHIRFKVAQEGKIEGTDTKRRGFGVRTPVYRIKGADMKLDPELMKNDIENEHYIIQEGLHNLAALELVNRIEAGPRGPESLARQIAVIDPRIELGDVTDAAGNPIRPDSAEARAVAPFVAIRKSAGKQNDRTFHVFRKGRLEIWEAESPELARLFRNVHSTGEMNIIATALEKFANLQRLGVVTAPDFTMRSVLRSEIEATITSAHPQPYPGHDLFHGILDVLKLREPYLDMTRKGAGEGATVTGMFRDVTKDELREIFVATGRESRMWNVFKHPLDALRTFKSRLLAASQVGYYKRVVNMGVDPRKAAMEARETYRDPQERAGLATINALDKFTPFFRVSRLDVDQFIQNVKRNPKKVFAYGIAYATIPTVINWTANYLFDETYGKDPQYRADHPGYRPYNEYTRFERDLYYVLPPIMGVRPRLPLKPFVSGFIFSSMVERTLDALVRHDPRAMKDWAQTFMAQVVPPVVPALFMPIWEHQTNTRAYSGRPLLPAALERLSPTMQYTPDTTETAKTLSKLMSPDLGILSNLHMGVNVAPVVIDNYIRELGGTMPMQFLKTLEMTLGKTPAHPWTVADIPFVRSFIAIEPGMTAQPIQDFYEESQKVLTVQADLAEARRRQNIPEFMDAYSDQRRAIVGRVNALRDVLANKAQIINAININKKMTDPEKVKAIDAQYSSMVILSKSGLTMIDEIKKLK